MSHHLRPVAWIGAEVKAIREWAAIEAPTPKPESKLRLYNDLSASGRGHDTWNLAQPDPHIQKAIEHDYSSHILQAIGRLRGALRPGNIPPARVLVLCNKPVEDLEIDELTTVRNLLTSPFQTPLFSSEIHEKLNKTEGLVGMDISPVTWDPWEEELGLVQDETEETQLLDPFWEGLVALEQERDQWDEGEEVEFDLLD